MTQTPKLTATRRIVLDEVARWSEPEPRRAQSTERRQMRETNAATARVWLFDNGYLARDPQQGYALVLTDKGRAELAR